MTNRSKIFSFAISSLMLMSVLACSNGPKMKVSSLSDAKEFVQQNYINFVEGAPGRLIGCANGYCNENGFGTTWSKDNIFYDQDDGMSLLLEVTDDMSRVKASSGDPYISAEMRSITQFRYGYFGTYMKPSNVKGTASTFFLYSDNPHDEIDIEFLGKDTTKVQFNYFKDGRGGNEYFYDLGFDASEDYHHYGIYWDKEEICWYVDFKPVYRLTGPNCPSARCTLIANHWAGSTKNSGIMGWMGHLDEDECPSFSRYKDLEIADLNGEQLKVIPTVKEYNICPEATTLETKPVKFKSVSGYYVVDETSTSEFEITYSKEDLYKDYLNVKLTAEGVEDMRYVQFKVKNLNDKDYPALCRLTVDTSGYGSGTTSNKFVSIWKNGISSTRAILKNNNLEAHYEVDQGEEAIMTFRWYGEHANELTMMFDDFGACPTVNGVGQRDGHIKVSDFKFGGVQDYVPIDTSGYVDELYTKNGEIEDPESQQAKIPEDFVKVNNIKFGSVDNYYEVSETEEGTYIAYNQPADGYQQTGYYGSNIFNGAREVILVMKNLNLKEVQIQVKIKNSVGGIVDTVDVLSDPSTGKLYRWSSSSPGCPYLAIAGGRTCQFKLTLSDNAKSIALVVSPGVGLSGACLVKGIYTKTSN